MVRVGKGIPAGPGYEWLTEMARRPVGDLGRGAYFMIPEQEARIGLAAE
jgi:hypothetical protein